MLHNICGRAKSGKTEYILSVCKKNIQNKKHTFLIVPEQGALAFERQVIERLGNSSNEYIEVINFKRLCNRVFRETGGLTQSYIDSAHKLLLMYKAIKSVRAFLTEYKGASENCDFIKKAVKIIDELKMYGIDCEKLEKTAQKLACEENSRLYSKLRDISLIYSGYNAMIKEVFGDDFNYRESIDDLERLSSVLCDSKFFKGKTVIIDSFYGFTVPEFSVIDRIIRDADDVYITYLLGNDKNDMLFARGKNAYERICNAARDNYVDFQDIQLEYDDPRKDENLKALERNFAFELRDTKVENHTYTQSGVKLYGCENAYREAKLTAAIINYLTAECNAKYSDIAVLARNPDDLSGILDTELTKNAIPFGFSVKYDLLTRPVASYITAAFEFSRNKSKQSVLRLLKTGLTPLTDLEADLVECYIRTWNIQGRMFTESEWMMNPDGYNDASQMSERNRSVLETVHNAREKLITPLCVFDEEIKAAECANDISLAIIKLLGSSKYIPEMLSEDEIVFHNMVMDALDCISDVCGNDQISAKTYSAIFEMILSEYNTGRIPTTVDEVTVANAELFRSAKTDYTIVLGLNDGIFPRNPSEDNVFSDRERNILRNYGLELSGTSADIAYDELFLAYKALSSASKGLFLMYSKKDSKGDASEPSSIVAMCKSALSGLREEDDTEICKLKLYLCDKSLVSEVSDSNREFAAAVSEHLAKKGIVPKSDVPAQKYLCKDTAMEVFGEDMLISPSRLDKFNNCACSYFGTYTLSLAPEKKASLGASETGNIIHKILELLISELSEKKQKGEELTVEYALEREKELLQGYIEGLVGKNTEKELSKRFRYLYGRLSGALDACVSALTNEIIQSEFIPSDFEMSIGTKNADIPFASIPILNPDGSKQGLLTITGKIDRTDIYKKGDKVYIRVADYKTGTKKFNLADVSIGFNLQMLLYLYSLTKNCGTRYGEGEAIPAGVLYTPVHRPSFNIELGEDSVSDEKNAFKTNGILIDDMEILTAMEKNLEGKFIPVKLKKDGGFYSGSSVARLETMGRLLSCAADVASKLAGEIKSGKIAKNPYKCDVNSCNFCDLAPFCRYESGEAGTRYSFTKYSDEDFTSASGGER